MNVKAPTVSAKRRSGRAGARRSITSPPRRVLHLLCPGTKLLDVAGPLQVFGDARNGKGRPAYESVLLSPTGGPVAVSAGLELASRPMTRVRVQPSDVVIVPGGPGVFAACDDTRILDWLRRHANKAGTVASTCTGAFLLAAAGLLDGRRAVTHWDDCAELQRRYPQVHVEEDPIYIQDGSLWTSAGVTAGIDLALALVERDLGHDVAVDIARRLVVYSKRPGGQSQFSNRLRQQAEDPGEAFEALHDWVVDHLAEDLRVERLAEQACMSPRSFYRAYTKSSGTTPARMVARMRVEAARRRLEETSLGVAAIARECGFGTEEHMRRTFQRELGMSPASYRDKWSR